MAFKILVLCVNVALAIRALSAGYLLQQDFDLPYVSLGRSPDFEIVQEQQLTKEVRDRFQRCLKDLETSEIPVSFFSQDLRQQASGLQAGFPKGAAASVDLGLPRALVEILDMGPVVLPLLVRELDNDLPVKAKVETHRDHLIRFFDRLHGNAANRREAQILTLSKECYVGSLNDYRRLPGRSVAATQAERYQFNLGDVCFVALGRIVGRNYQCLVHVDAFTLGICSTVFNDQMRVQVQTLWSSPRPCEAVYRSLMYDFCTIGVTLDGTRDKWDQGNDLQVAAVIRLIKYFPVESKEAIHQRLKTLCSLGSTEESDRVNGVDICDLVLAISATTQDPELLKAISELHPDENDASLREAIKWIQSRSRP